jgi:phosphate transport system permease protein
MNKRKYYDVLFKFFCGGVIWVALGLLVWLMGDVFLDGLPWLNIRLFTSFPSRFPSQAGLLSALVGTGWVILGCGVIAFPLGVGAAVYLEEYAKDNWLTRLVNINIANLAGVPSIIYGILGLEIFVRTFKFDRSILSGSLTLGLLILPIVTVAARESIRAVPPSMRYCAYALGATKWQVVRTILGYALPGILTGTILALARAIGETAPLIMIGAFAFVAFLPSSPLDPFTVLPIQIFSWTTRPHQDFHQLAAAGIIVLLMVLLLLNAGAIYLRNRYRIRW